MKTIGLIGGMSWESTIPYYRHINETVRAERGGLHSAKVVLHSVDFQEIELLMRANDWQQIGQRLGRVGQSLEAAGADFLVLCTNTMHIVAPAIEAAVRIPLHHIADPTAVAVKAQGYHTVALIGTRPTMAQSFYKDRLAEHHGLTVITPDATDQDAIHSIIFEELCLGKINAASRIVYRQAMAALVQQGAQAIILGCTEISLLVDQSDCSVPLFDTTALHAVSAAKRALAAG
jgi:aspartate racemase